MVDVVRISEGSTLKDGPVVLVWRDRDARYGGGGHTWRNGYDWSYAVGPDADDLDVHLTIKRARSNAALTPYMFRSGQMSDDLNDEGSNPQKERARMIAAMQRLIDEGRASGISSRTVPEILAEARMLARQRRAQSE